VYAEAKIDLLVIGGDGEPREKLAKCARKLANWRLLYARSAAEAANLLDSYHFDAVLVIDPIVLEGETNSLRGITELAGHSPVILATIDNDIHRGNAAMQLGALDFLPISETTNFLLYRTVLYAIERRHFRDELVNAHSAETLEKVAIRAAAELEQNSHIFSRYCNRMNGMTPDVVEALESSKRLGVQLRQATGTGKAATQDLNVNDCIERAIARFTLKLPASVTIQTELEPHIWAVQGCRRKFDEALHALIKNAIEAMPNGGACVVSTINRSRVDIEDNGNGPTEVTKHTVGVRISDTGWACPPCVIPPRKSAATCTSAPTTPAHGSRWCCRHSASPSGNRSPPAWIRPSQ
jgi:signal transduction histidine kinase